MTSLREGISDRAVGARDNAETKLEEAMAQIQEIELAILHDLERRGPCAMEELVRRLPLYTWNQVFTAVDRLSRAGTLILQLRHPARFDYLVSARTHSASLPGHTN